MKSRSLMKRGVMIASALLASSSLVPVGWAQQGTQRPGKAPRQPVERKLPDVKKPNDPRVPILVEPPTIQSPLSHDGFDMDKPLVVKGKGINNARIHVTVRGEWEQKVGQQNRYIKGAAQNIYTYASSKGDWQTTSIRLNIPQGATKIKLEVSAVQSVAGKSSKAAVVTLTPILKMAPLKTPQITVTLPPSLTITAPKNDSKVTPPFTIAGTAVGGTQVNVRVKIEYTIKNPKVKTNLTARETQVVDNIPIKNGKWSTKISVDRDLKNVTSAKYVIYAEMAHSKGIARNSIDVKG